MVRHNAVIVFQCASSLYTRLDPWCTKHEINLSLVSSLVCVLELLFRLHPGNIVQIDEIALAHLFGNALGFLTQSFVCIQIEDNLMVQRLFLVNKSNQVRDKLFLRIRGCLGLTVLHKDRLECPCTAVSTCVAYTEIPSDNCNLGVSFPYQSLIASASHP